MDGDRTVDEKFTNTVGNLEKIINTDWINGRILDNFACNIQMTWQLPRVSNPYFILTPK